MIFFLFLSHFFYLFSVDIKLLRMMRYVECWTVFCIVINNNNVSVLIKKIYPMVSSCRLACMGPRALLCFNSLFPFWFLGVCVGERREEMNRRQKQGNFVSEIAFFLRKREPRD